MWGRLKSLKCLKQCDVRCMCDAGGQASGPEAAVHCQLSGEAAQSGATEAGGHQARGRETQNIATGDGESRACLCQATAFCEIR